LSQESLLPLWQGHISVDPDAQQTRGKLVSGNTEEKYQALKIYLRILCAGDIALGPGKADLMESIRQQGSLSKAGRALGISYRRVWNMVEAINGGFKTPLILTSHGGRNGGGAALSETGEEVLSLYRSMQEDVAMSAHKHFEHIKKYLKTAE
jgi:molybdate transport system regulatory protein